MRKKVRENRHRKLDVVYNTTSLPRRRDALPFLSFSFNDIPVSHQQTPTTEDDNDHNDDGCGDREEETSTNCMVLSAFDMLSEVYVYHQEISLYAGNTFCRSTL